MLSLLRKINKLLESLSILVVPVIIFYWLLKIINLSQLSTVVNLLEYVLNPILKPVYFFFKQEVFYNEQTIDVTPLIAACFVFGVFFTFSWIDKILRFVEDQSLMLKQKAIEKKERRQLQMAQDKYLEDLTRNKVVYLVLNLINKETASAYLFNGEEDLFAEGMMNNMLKKILESSESYNGKKYEDFKSENGTFRFVFFDVADALDYSFFVHNMILSINREVLDLSRRMSYIIAAHSSISESTAKEDFSVAEKMLKLCTNNEILVSEMFRNKYEALKQESNVSFMSNGVYAIDEDQVEVYKLVVNKKENLTQ